MHVLKAGARFVAGKMIRTACELNFPLPLRTRIRAMRGGSLNKIALIAPDLSFVYVSIPKAANSTIKRVLLALYGRQIYELNSQILHADVEPYLTIPQLSTTELGLALRSS